MQRPPLKNDKNRNYDGRSYPSRQMLLLLLLRQTVVSLSKAIKNYAHVYVCIYNNIFQSALVAA
jgi:hypothetical protein